jgi:hypothetical protein
MLRRVAIFSLLLLALAGIALIESRAGEADTIAAINASSNTLDEAFAKRDVATIKALMTADHVTERPTTKARRPSIRSPRYPNSTMPNHPR